MSTVMAWKVQLQRQIDHSYRHLIGVPTLRRSEITPQLFLGGQYSRRGFSILKKRGITGIVSMRERATQGLPDMGKVQFLHLPTIDMTPPTIENLQKGVKFMTQQIEDGGKVYIHCAAGEGRGPSMVIAYLISTGMTYDDAYETVKKVRPFIRPTLKQVERLQEFEKLYALELLPKG